MYTMKPANVLYVDSDQESCDLIKRSVSDTECIFSFSSGAQHARELLARRSFDLYIFEYCLTETTGAELCRTLRSAGDLTPVIIYTALYRDIDRQKSQSAGANAFVVKSDGFHNLSVSIRRLLEPRPSASRRYNSVRGSSAII